MSPRGTGCAGTPKARLDGAPSLSRVLCLAVARTLHVKPASASRLKIGRGAGRVLFVEEGDGSAVVVYGEQPSARFASLGELLELHGLAEADVEEREPLDDFAPLA